MMFDLRDAIDRMLIPKPPATPARMAYEAMLSALAWIIGFFLCACCVIGIATICRYAGF